MKSPNMDGKQTAIDGSVTQTYIASQSFPVTVTPDAGYYISNLAKNGSIQTLADPASAYSTIITGPAAQSVHATFNRIPSVLTAVAGANGTVSPSRITHTKLGAQSPAKIFTFIPARGYRVQSVHVPGHVLGKDYQFFDAATGKLVTLPAAADVKVKVSVINLNGPATLTASFAVMGAYAGPNQTVLAGSPVTLDGSASTGATSYSWSQVSGPAKVTLYGATANKATFSAPARVGTYVFKLATNGGTSSSTTTIYVTNSTVAAARRQCQNCHEQAGVGVNAKVFPNWSTSAHAHSANAVMCYNCHIGTNTGGHPGLAVSSVVNVCAHCHDLAAHPFQTGSYACTFCHDPHSASPYRKADQ